MHDSIEYFSILRSHKNAKYLNLDKHGNISFGIFIMKLAADKSVQIA